MKPALSVENLSCWRGERLLFEELGFTVETGGCLALTGPNGIGKSSLLAVLAGLLKPGHGRILFRGATLLPHEVFWLGVRTPFYPEATLFDNLHLWATLNNFGKLEVSRAVEEYGLLLQKDMPAGELSRGQSQKAHLARLNLSRASIWLLDEPLTGLDEPGKEMFLQKINSFRARGGIVIVAPIISELHSETLSMECFVPKDFSGERRK